MAVAAQSLQPRLIDQVGQGAFDQVEGALNYLVDTGVKPFAYNYEPPPGVPQRSGTYEEHRLPILNGRRRGEDFSLDGQGFLFRQHETAVKDFYDPAEVERVYYPEIEALMKQATGAEKVVTFDHTLRVGSARQQKGLREPVRRVHNDYTVKSGPQRVRDLLDASRGGRAAEAALRHRQYLAPDPRAGGRSAAGGLRCPQHRAQRSDRDRSALPRPHR